MILKRAARKIAYLRGVVALVSATRRRDLQAMEAAVQLLRAADPTDTMGLSLLAIHAEGGRNPESAMPIWEEVLSVDPANVQALRGIADHCANRGDPELACAAIRRALTANAKNTDRKLTIVEKGFLRLVGPLIGRDAEFFEQLDRAATKSDRDWNRWARKYLAVHDAHGSVTTDESVN